MSEFKRVMVDDMDIGDRVHNRTKGNGIVCAKTARTITIQFSASKIKHSQYGKDCPLINLGYTQIR